MGQGERDKKIRSDRDRGTGTAGFGDRGYGKRRMGGEGNMGKLDMEQGDMGTGGYEEPPAESLLVQRQPGREVTCPAPLLGPAAYRTLLRATNREKTNQTNKTKNKTKPEQNCSNAVILPQNGFRGVWGGGGLFFRWWFCCFGLRAFLSPKWSSPTASQRD